MMLLSVLTARSTLRLLDLLELRLALVPHLGRLQLLLVHARGLGNLREQDGLRRLLRARDGGQHARARMLERDLLEVRGQLGVANVQGPSKSGAENQRPDTR